MGYTEISYTELLDLHVIVRASYRLGFPAVSSANSFSGICLIFTVSKESLKLSSPIICSFNWLAYADDFSSGTKLALVAVGCVYLSCVYIY